MQTWQSGHAPVRIKWFQVPGFDFYEKPTPFRSSVWWQPEANDGLGEQRQLREDGKSVPTKWYSGAMPAGYLFPGHVEGEDEVWREGGVEGQTPPVVTGPDGVPEGCPVLRWPGGGEEEGGDAVLPVPAPAVEVATSAVNSGHSVTVNLFGVPPAEGSLLLAVWFARTPADTPSYPAGWTLFSDQNCVPGSVQAVAWKIAGASEPTSFAFGYANTGSGIEAFFFVITGAAAPEAQQVQSGTSTTPTLPSFTTSSDSNLLLGVLQYAPLGGLFFGGPAGWTGALYEHSVYEERIYTREAMTAGVYSAASGLIQHSAAWWCQVFNLPPG